jgi:hypothetical protein
MPIRLFISLLLFVVDFILILFQNNSCAACNYDLCSSCLGKTKATMPTRVHVHPLVYTTTGLSSHYCDCCSLAITRDAWRCATCNYDVCSSCFETVQLPKPTPTVTPSDAKVTPVVAKHAHGLTATTGAAGHYCDNWFVLTLLRCAY